jgi:hypothetical protein
MAIIVKHLATENEYVFLGIQSPPPTKVFGDLFTPEEKTGKIAVCDYQGQILCFNASELVVIEIDGQIPADVLPEIVAPTPLDTPANTEEMNSEEDGEWI